MAVSWTYFALSAVGLAFTVNALRPPRWGPASVPAFFAGWLTSELPAVHIIWQAIATALFAWRGAMGNWPGSVGLAMTAMSWFGLAILEAASLRSWRYVDAAFGSLGPSSVAPQVADIATSETRSGRPAVPWSESRIPLPLRRRSIVRFRNIDYWGDDIPPHRLDIYSRRSSGVTESASVAPSPVLFYIHGGGWVIGDKREQGLPMIHHLAAQGWVCVTINYRLSPRSAWPDHIIDCKKALAWIKDHIGDYGGDPGSIVVSGGSAGGHLASLVALTAGTPQFQPGFETADTSVAACVPIYGVYDFTNDGRIFDPLFIRFLERTVFKKKLAENRELFEGASPYWRVHDGAPPFLVIAGRNDTLVPVGEPRRFVERLRSVSPNPVAYIELPFAQHAFEIFASVRSTCVIRSVERFFEVVKERQAPPPKVIPAEEASHG